MHAFIYEVAPELDFSQANRAASRVCRLNLFLKFSPEWARNSVGLFSITDRHTLRSVGDVDGWADGPSSLLLTRCVAAR